MRLLDILDTFRGDFRIQPIFAIDEGTRSGAGVQELLRGAGIHRTVPWTALRDEVHYDLAISASEQIDLDTVTSTTIVLPHGVGFNKYVPDGNGGGRRVAGLPPASAFRTGRVRLVLSHPDQLAQLAGVNPEIGNQTAITGDPTFDRLLASQPLRAHYRDALAAGDRTLILLSSTWSIESAFGRWRELPRQLLAELPADQYRVCVALHPNIWSRHEPAVIRTWLADCLDAGLHLLPADRGWQAAVVAADLVLGDNGSITLLAAGLGKPVLLAAFGPDTEVVPGTPMADFGRVATRLDPDTPLRDQLDEAVATHDPGRFTPVISRTFANVGEATDRLRKLIYRELGLEPPPSEPILRRFPDPEAEHQPAAAFDVYAKAVRPGQVTLLRYPRPVHDPTAAPSTLDRHLAVSEDCNDLWLIQRASVITRAETDRRDRALAWTEGALRDLPGTRIAALATKTGCVTTVRGGGQFEIVGTTDVLVLASALYCCLIAGQLVDGPLTIHAGVSTTRCTVRKL